MKKFLSMIGVMLALCMSTVWADMGAPEVKPYKAYISNFDGAEYFNYDTRETLKLDYGTKIYVIYEDYYSQDNIVYVTAQVGVEHEQMGAPYLQIKLSDISIINGAEVIPDNLATITKDKAIFKTKKSGAEMKKGPAEVYESTGTMVPDGADITIYDYAS